MSATWMRGCPAVLILGVFLVATPAATAACQDITLTPSSGSQLARAYVGDPYSTSVKVAGGVEPYSWHYTQSDLPSGLSFSVSSSSGTNTDTLNITGTPTIRTGGIHNFTGSVVDNHGNGCLLPWGYGIRVVGPPDVTGFSPDHGGAGAVVEIDGTDLGGSDATVTFTGGAIGMPNASSTDGAIFVAVPPFARTGPVTLTTPAGSDATGGPFTVVAEPPGITPTMFDFGSIDVGSMSVPVSIIVTPPGPTALDISTVSVPGPFFVTEDGCAHQVIAPGSSCTIKVALKPDQPGPAYGHLMISDNASNTPQSVTLQGTGVTPGGPPGIPDFRMRFQSISKATSTGVTGELYLMPNDRHAMHGAVALSFTITNDGTAPGEATWHLEFASDKGRVDPFSDSNGLLLLYGGEPGLRDQSIGRQGGCRNGASGDKVQLAVDETVTVKCRFLFADARPGFVALSPGTLIARGTVTPFDNPGNDDDTDVDNLQQATVRVVEGAVSKIDALPRNLTPGVPPDFHGTTSSVAPPVPGTPRLGTLKAAAGPKVQIAVLRVPRRARAATNGKPCEWLESKRARFVSRPAPSGVCTPPVWLSATGSHQWHFKMRKGLPRGHYVIYARAVSEGIPQIDFSPHTHSRRAFRVH